jgi:RNA polymerase sigma-70 factor (ECF subfamily)
MQLVINGYNKRIFSWFFASYRMDLSNTSEQALLKGARRFDLKALETVYDRYNPGIYRYAMRLLGDVQLAEDCVSEIFSRFLKVLRAEQGPDDHLQAYLYRMAHNWITDHYRHSPLPSVDLDSIDRPDPDISTENSATQNIEQKRVRNALRQLTPEQRHVVMLRYYEGWELEDVAQSLQKDIGAVKALQHRAVDALRRILTTPQKEVI